ncbi:hypothetical protein GCM10011349_42480 [Novosphingobium indicum]|uniref:Uncharacterized protein n=1 Tax=Novosphingobium indicum TaxID=462949 RepID=A0ABQ2K2V1_9SPHN|nr:hypothetical protein GCM10011349_42480 [Novosphingobium indicum]
MQCLDQQCLQHALDDDPPSGIVGHAFFGQQLNESPEPGTPTLRSRDLNEAGQQTEQKRRVDPFEGETATKRDEIRFTLLLSMSNGLVARFEETAFDLRIAIQRKCRR